MSKLVVLYCPHDSYHDPVIHFISSSLSQHPEKPRRSACLLKAISKIGIHSLVECNREATIEELESIHSKELVHFIINSWNSLFSSSGKENGEIVLDISPFSICRKVQYKPKALHLQAGFFCFDISTPIGKHTARIARISASIAIDAAKRLDTEISEGHITSLIYALCRPPGHHATYNFYGGYCYFNNAALAAQILSKRGRVVVFDVDYHHGNGTQDIFYDRNDVYYISIHGDPEFEYPYHSGGANEIGIGEGIGYNRNFPLPCGIDWREYKPVFEESLALIKNYNPTSIVISLGLDAAEGDPICSFHLKPEDYHLMGCQIRDMKFPVLVIQEGGYSNDEILGSCANSFIKGLMGIV